MENLYNYLQSFVQYEAFDGVFTNKTKDNTEFKKVKINLINLKGEKIYQIEKFTDKQAFHKNANSNEIIDELTELFKLFMEFTFNANGFSHHIKITKKGTILYNKKANSSEMLIKNHNKEKLIY